jgi:hypothetical protein
LRRVRRLWGFRRFWRGMFCDGVAFLFCMMEMTIFDAHLLSLFHQDSR